MAAPFAEVRNCKRKVGQGEKGEEVRLVMLNFQVAGGTSCGVGGRSHIYFRSKIWQKSLFEVISSSVVENQESR